MSTSNYLKKLQEIKDRAYGTQEESKPSTSSPSTGKDSTNSSHRVLDRIKSKINGTYEFVNQDYINSFMSEANDFFKSAEDEYSKVGWGNASSAYNSKKSKWMYLDSQERYIRGWLNSNKGNLDEETYNSISSALDGYKSGFSSTLKAFEDANNFYSQFETEDSYNKWKKTEDEKKAVLEAEDYGKYSQIGANIENPAYEDAKLDKYNLWDALFKDDIVNPVTFGRNNKEKLDKRFAGSGSSADVGVVNQYYQYNLMTDEEVGIYNYYLGKGDVEKANEYLESIQDTLNRRHAGKIVENIDGNKALEMMFAVGAGLDQFVSGIRNIDNYLKGEEADPTTVTQYASSEIRNDLDGFWGGAYDVVTNTSNMLPSILVGSLTGGIGGTITMSASAIGNSYAEMRNLGYEDWQAAGYATLVGASEGLLQSALGGISKLGGKYSLNKGITKLVSGLDNAFAKLAIQLPLNMASEALEESIQTVLEPAFKALMTGEDYEAPEWEEILYSGLLGALSAGLIEGGVSTIGTVGSAVNANKIKNAYGGDVENILTDAASIKDTGKSVDKYINKYGKKGELSGWNISRLLDMTDTNKVKSAIEAKLTSLGEKGDVSQLADILTKQAKGIELSKKEQKILDSSTYGKRMTNSLDPEKIKSGEYDTDWVKNIGTRALNASVYNKSAYDLVKEAVLEAENTPQKEISTEGKFEPPADAKITIERDGEKVEVKANKIASLENGEMTIELEGGETVNVDEVDFGESGIGLVYQAAKDMSTRVGGFNVDTANVFVRGFNPESGLTSGEYIDGWISAYKFGAQNSPFSALATNRTTMKLTEEQRKTAYNFGKAFGNEKVVTNKKSEGFVGEYTKRSYNPDQAELLSALPVEALQNAMDSNGAVSFNAIGLGGDTATQQKWIDAGLTYTEDGKTYVDENAVLDERDRRRNASKQEKIVNTVSNNPENISKTDSKKKKGRVIFDGAKKLNERQRASLKALNFLAKALNKNIYVEKISGDNGWYDPVTGDIHIDLNAGALKEALLLFTMSHELTHDIKTRLAEKFNVLADAVFEEYTNKFGDHVMEDLVKEKIDFLKEQGDIKENMTEEEIYDLAYEEVICDCLETMLVDSNAIEALSKNIYGKDKTLWQRIKDFISNLIARIKAAYADVIPDSKEGQMFRELGEGAERIKKLWVDAIVELSEIGSDANTNSGDVVNVIEDGQFYKVRGEDAVRLSKEVDLTLTQETVNGKKVPMVGFPLRYFDTYAKKAADKGITLEKATVKHSYSSISYSFFGDKTVTVKDFENGSYTKTEGYKRYVDQCLNNMRQTSENFNEDSARKEIEDSIAGIVKVAVAMKKAGYDILDNHAKRSTVDSKNRLLFSSLEPNSDYFTSSDISTICDKRMNFAEIYDEIVRREEALNVPKGKRFFDNVDNYFILHKIMADKGLTQPCRQCYVESMRKNLAPMANAFLKLMQETDPNNKANDQLFHTKGKSKGESKTNNAKLRENLLETIEAEEYDITVDKLTVEMLTTEDGLAQLKLQAPLIYEAFNSFYGQSKPKMPKSATPFRFGELTAMLTDNKGNIKKSLIDKIISTGGFRLQSYSDFQIQNFADVLQVIFEAGTLGLNGHAYTKVPAFLDATKGTNLKRNISIFMYKDGGQWKIDRNDSFPYDLDKIYDIVKSDMQGNTSIIAVVQNEDMAAWIMANDNVGYFIPFHKSGMKMGTVRETIVKEGGREIKGYSGIKDHTRQQTEVWAKTTADHKAYTKVKKGINIYDFWDFDNVDNISREGLIEKNVKAYIDACNEAGYLPKFREYVMNNSKVLNSVLTYSKQLGFVSQGATIDDISFEYKGYRIPYGYYKCLGDFGMFTPNGEASTVERLSLKDYNFDEAEAFFSNAETLRRNEILQQIANGEERERYRNSDMTTAEIAEEVQSKRNQVVEEVVSGEYKKVKHSGRASGKSDYSDTEAKITADMTEEERHEALKKRSINNIPLSTELSSDVLEKIPEISSWDDINKYFGKDKKTLINKLAKEFKVFGKEYINEDTKLTFEFSGHNFSESYGKQGRNFESFAKMFSVFDAVVEGAVGIEIHNRSDYKPDPTLDNVFVLMGAYQDGDSIVPVKLEVKQFKDKQNTLYVAISLEKIKMTELNARGNTENGVTQRTRSVNMSIAQIFSKINPSDKNFLKYIPDGFLDSKQKAAKQEALIEDADNAYMSAIKRNDMQAAQKMVDEAAKEAGYNSPKLYHGTPLKMMSASKFKLTASEYAELGEKYDDKLFPFVVFKTEKSRSGLTYTATSREAAETFAYPRPGTVFGLYGRFENPLVVNEHIYESVPYYYEVPTPSVMKEAGISKATLSTEEIAHWAKTHGYDGVIVEGLREGGGEYTDDYITFTSSQLKSADPVTYDDNGNVIPLSERFNPKNSDIRYSHRADKKASYAPTFYSHMGKVIDDIRIEKMGAGGVVSYLKGKGVKDEEIKWSGIEAFLEGKKSVTKAELQEFVAGSQLQIEETNSGINNDAYTELDSLWRENFLSPLEDVFDPEDFDETTVSAQLAFLEENGMDMPSEDIQQRMIVLAHKIGKPTRWEQYKLDGGSNYRELVFKLPNSTYSNRAMRGHWGQDAEGVLAHARIQDFIVNGKKMLFIEEIQSDWHNEGREKGYTTKEYEDAYAVYDKLAEDYANKRRAFNQYVRSGDFRTDPDEVSKKKFDWLRMKMDTAEKRMQEAERDIEALKEKGMGDVPDAPFRNNYHEYVLKRLLRMAAEEGYDSIGWTPADIQSKRWSKDYAEAYRIEYDQDIPKFLRKYGKRWGATVGFANVRTTRYDRDYYEERISEIESEIEQYKDELDDDNTEDYNIFIQEGISDLQNTLNNLYEELRGEKIWSMDISDAMKDSVLYEGQPKYSRRLDKKASYSDRDTSNLIGKEMMFYAEGDRKPDLTLVEVFNERTGKTETTVKFVGDKPTDYIPQKIAYCYKLFEQHPDGTLHALFAGASNATPIGEWQYAMGFPYTDSGVKGMDLRERYGWHLSAGLPSAPHLMSSKDFERGYPSKNAFGHPKGSKRVWVRMAYDASVDFNSLADSTKGGDIFGLIPFGGYYAFKENNQSEWVISSAVKIDKILTEDERQQILKDAGYDEYEAWRRKHRATEAEKAESKRQSAENKKAKDKAKKEGRNYLSESAKEMREAIKSRIIVNPELSNVKHQHRATDVMKPRSLLANALESAAQNDIEREKLRLYKEKIDLLNAEEQKLDELNEKIHELSFKKGPRDTEAIKSLQFEANQTANRINTYDRQLFNLESTKALKGVLEREKAQARKRAEQKANQRRKEDIARVKGRAAKTERELMTRYQESRKRGIESRSKTAMKHKIKNVVSDLNKLLLNPTKDQHVPIGLQKVVADALDVINMDTMNAGERVAYYNDLISKATNPDEIDALTKKRDFFEYRDANFKERITALKNAYADFKESDDPLIRNAHNDAIEDLIKSTADEVGNKSLKEMSLEQLEKVYDMYKAILATVRNSNKMFKEGRQATITENSEAVKTEVREVGGHKDRVNKLTKGTKAFGWNLLKPIYALRAIGSNTLTKLYENVRAGEDTYAVDISEAREFFKDKSKEYNYDSWDFKKRYNFKDSTGTEFSLSLEQIMSLYAYSKREQADRHLDVGGFVFDDSIEVTEKKFGIPFKYEVNDANPYRLRKEDLIAITSSLTKDQKGFIDEMQSYLSEVMGAKGNEVSLAMYDIKLYKEKNYFPLKTSRYFREYNPEQSGNPMLRNSGFSKKTVPKAGNPIVLSNFMDVWTGHVNDMSMYHSFVLALEDFMRVYNYSSTAGGYDSVQQYIKNAYGAQANQYIEKLMQDINGGVVSGNIHNGMLKMFSKFKKATVAASLSTIVQQPTAVIRAMSEINPVYFVGVPFKDGHKKTWEEIKKYAPVAIIKEMGGFDVGSGRQAKDYIGSQKKGILGKIDDAFMWGATKADELGWNIIWKAVKREVASKQKLKPGTEEFYKACGKRFTEVVTQTQVYDSVFSRSGIMRDKGDLNKFATSFMGEPTTSLNMIFGAVLDAKRGGSKVKAVGKIASVYASIVGAAAMAALVYALRDDDEDESYLEKYAEALGNKLSSEVWMHNMVPYIRDIASIIEGWDVERPDMSIFADIKSSFDKLYKVNEDGEFEWKVDFSDPKSVYSAIENFGGSIASAFGVPLKNILRDTRGIFNGIDDIFDDIKPSGVGDAFINGWTGEEKKKTDAIYEAILNGDNGRLEIYKKGYKTEDAYETAVRKALRDNDPRIKEAAQARYDGDISTYTRIAKEIIREGNFSQDTVVAAINSEISAIKNSESTDTDSNEDEDEATSIYKASDINDALESGDTALAKSIIDDLVKTKVANGKTEKEAKSSLRSSLTSYWKPLYKEAYNSGNASEMARIRKILYSSGLYGTADEVVKSTQAWLKD